MHRAMVREGVEGMNKVELLAQWSHVKTEEQARVWLATLSAEDRAFVDRFTALMMQILPPEKWKELIARAPAQKDGDA